MFPTEIIIKNNSCQIINNHLTHYELKTLFINNPYEVYAMVNESLEEEEPMLTTFLILYSVDFEDNVILYDISRQMHTTLTTKLSILEKGYLEFIDVGMVDRHPIKFYKREQTNEDT
ncbi:hypothetical protein [Bacillus sp. EB01]|uniref:hypothetical protein n=1 Tax=Bacillus sp. EB01 TaxID=1347086 RepID=UPI0005C6EE5E|nr:hypothetical protein [Bacillus sp. EB01]